VQDFALTLTIVTVITAMVTQWLIRPLMSVIARRDLFIDRRPASGLAPAALRDDLFTGARSPEIVTRRIRWFAGAGVLAVASVVVLALMWPTFVVGNTVCCRMLLAVGIAIVGGAIFLIVYLRNWRRALAASVASLVELVIVAAVFAVSGQDVTAAVLAAFVAVAAFSLYDKAVVFTRVRENASALLEGTRNTYAERANLSVNQTLGRSLNTIVLMALPLGALLFGGVIALGADTLCGFSLVLFVGLPLAAASSLFLAVPLEATLRQTDAKVKEHTVKVLAARPDGDAAAFEEAEAVVQVIPGSHQGVKAQPRRRTKR